VFTVIGSPGDRRVELFQAALHSLHLPAAEVIPYPTIADLTALPITPFLRIESPGKDPNAQRYLLGMNVDLPKGQLFNPYRWYCGLDMVMRRIEALRSPITRWMNPPEDILIMFDKWQCRTRLESIGIPQPRSLGPISGYEDLISKMRDARINRVFIKLTHGSNASGMIAYRTLGHQHQAITTIENGFSRLYNSRKLRTLTTHLEIALLIDEVCMYPTHAEEWIPKAAINNQVFDLRLVIIKGRVCQGVVRQSHTPITNLHLLNQRGDLDTVKARLRPGQWDAIVETSERVMTAFPNSLYAGIDLLITSDFRRHYVLEVNAFGDLLPGVLYKGHDTYTEEILAVLDDAPRHS
jgi:hypothetical protein